MKKLKNLMFVALFGVMSFGAFSAYNHITTMSAEEKALLENIEALTSGETTGGGSSFIGEGIVYGTCSSSVMYRLNCSVYCSICGKIFEATPIVRNAVGTATSGYCKCGCTFFKSRY